jgi:hypothetical protein
VKETPEVAPCDPAVLEQIKWIFYLEEELNYVSAPFTVDGNGPISITIELLQKVAVLVFML